jgi:hypothetical protein
MPVSPTRESPDQSIRSDQGFRLFLLRRGRWGSFGVRLGLVEVERAPMQVTTTS